jgi:predicted transcriptional regulator YdeE
MGSGQIEQVRVVERERIEQRLRLRHPFSMFGKSQWDFRELADKTEVTWTLRGRVSFSMRAFSSTVQSSLALDCRFGLDRLASLVEPATASRYSVERQGLRDVASGHYVYRSYQGSIRGVPDAMRSALAELRQELKQCGVRAAGEPMVLYFKTNIKLKTTVCYIGIPVEGTDGIGSLPVRAMPAHRAYVVCLRGGAAALEVAWYLAMQRMVAEKLQPDQRLPPFERYLVNSDGTPENDCVTELYLPVLPPR